MVNSISSANPFSLLSDDAPNVEVNAHGSKFNQQKSVTRDKEADRSKLTGRASRSDYPTRGGHRRTIPVHNDRDSANGFVSGDNRRSRPSGGRRGGRRAFDRHSATGLVDSEKKTRQGWLGDDAATVEDAEKAAQQAQLDESKDRQQELSSAEATSDDNNVKTLDEYLQEKSAKQPTEDQQKQLRQANDGQTDQVLKDAVLLNKEDEVFFVGNANASQKSRRNKERHEKTFVDIEQRFVDSERPRRGGFRGNRGDSRSGRRAGRGKGGPRTDAAINLHDQQAFPSLGN